MSYYEEMIWTYVPDAEFYSFDDAVELAFQRDRKAAEELLWSIQDA